MIDPGKVALFIPNGLLGFKQKLFDRIGEKIIAAGGLVVRGCHDALDAAPNNIVLIVGCTPELRPLIDRWRARGRTFCYWDRGYCRRVFATWLPRGSDGGYYRWHLNSYQLQAIKDVPDDRWQALKTDVTPWQKNGRHIVVAAPTRTYSRFHGLDGWTEKTLDALAFLTDRQIVVRGKESKRALQFDLAGAHCLVAHGSNAANEAVILGCPVFVDATCAAALVGQTDLTKIEKPVYPERQPWLNALAYSQFSEQELVDGNLWRLLS